MERKIFSQLVTFKIASVLTIAMSLLFIYIIFFDYPLNDLRSLIAKGSVITYNRGSGVIVGALPTCIYLFFFSLFSLLKKGCKPVKTNNIISSISGVIIILTFSLGLISLFVIPVWLTASSYTPCREEHLIRYYVTDPQLCETLPIKLDKRKWIGLSKFSSSSKQ
ncbi:hypothetical protein AB1E22_05295 [Buttiauxella gaviniae]|uniref:DUF1240 domain-containing protein n=1 Tax=Buttiauxella gaviniae TaxID=82990 RepID=A0ABV3NRG0_9ENTR